MLPPWLPSDLSQEIDFAHHGIPAYRFKHPSCNVPAILVTMISVTCERQPRAPLLTNMPSNNASTFVFRETSCCALSISRFLRAKIQMEAVTAKEIYTSLYQLGVETIDNGNRIHMQQEELYLCQNRTAYTNLIWNQDFCSCRCRCRFYCVWLHQSPA
jgi:hypothetical protein